MFPSFEVFGRTVGSYGLCAIVGLLVCGVVACLLARRYKIAYEDIVLLMVVIGVSLLIGGHILFGITNTNKLIALFGKASSYSLKQIFGYLITCFGGMVFYGGFLGACVGLLIYTKVSKEVERGIAFDLFAVCIPLFHVFGRIGCFLSGCCYGTECKFGFVVHGNTLVPEINDVRRLPVPLIEAVCNLVIFLILLRMFQKGKESGKMIFYYMLMYPAARFVLEFFRGDAIRGFLFGLSTSQWISIGLLAVAVWKLFFSKAKAKRGAICAGVLLAITLAIGGATSAIVVYATEDAGQEVIAADNGEQNVKTEDASDAQTGDSVSATGETGAESAEEEPPFNTKEKFVIFTCCLFSVALCVVIGLYGNPNDRLKDKYKRARKQQMLQEKKKNEAEKRAARRAAEDAKYAEELAQYEADVKAYEEAKAAKAAAKAAKKEAKKK
ncbi:MAG: prolipoprotein diacylglyceryl transferase [Lachnospiraceae bacterium]|nr:prolipoprotein diacylglyceryl transferase [Lachnospiraceae bacterium]